MNYQKEILEVIGYKIEEAAREEIRKHTEEILHHLNMINHHCSEYVFVALPGWRKHQELSTGQVVVKDITMYDLMQDLQGKLMSVYLKPFVTIEAKKFYNQITSEPAESPTQEDLTFIDVESGTIIAAPEEVHEDDAS